VNSPNNLFFPYILRSRMAGGSEEYVLCVRCGYTFENDYGGAVGEGEVRS